MCTSALNLPTIHCLTPITLYANMQVRIPGLDTVEKWLSTGKERTMGDKGQKDKDKSKKQMTKKQDQKAKKAQDKAPKRRS